MQVVFILIVCCLQFLNISSDSTRKVVVASGHNTIISDEIYHNHNMYSLHQGYNYSRFNTLDEEFKKHHAPHWMKVIFILNIFKDAQVQWVLWLDSDAIFVNISRGIDNIVNDFNVPNNISFIFAADASIINSGVLLMKNNPWMKDILLEVWKIGLKLDKHPKVGMGYDNAALIMFLAGCNSSSSYEELQACFFKGDLGNRDKKAKSEFFNANPSIFLPIIDKNVAPHIHILPHNSLNCYNSQAAEFIFHIPNRRRVVKEKILKDLISHLNFSEPTKKIKC